jgi:hypothetical protein
MLCIFFKEGKRGREERVKGEKEEPKILALPLIRVLKQILVL